MRNALETRPREIEGVIVSDSMFGNGYAYWVNGTKIAHIEHDDVIEVRLTRSEIRERRPAVQGRRSG